MRLSPAAEQRIDSGYGACERHSSEHDLALRQRARRHSPGRARSPRRLPESSAARCPTPGARVDARVASAPLDSARRLPSETRTRAPNASWMWRERGSKPRVKKKREASTLQVEGSASVRRLETAREARKVAEAEVELSTQRRAKQVSRAPFSADAALPIRAPASSVVIADQRRGRRPGFGGAKLVDLVPLRPLALHVPIYAADYGQIDRHRQGAAAEDE